jgi:hypothetical protein
MESLKPVSLSFDCGKPLGIIRGGVYDGEIIFLDDKSSEDKSSCLHGGCLSCEKGFSGGCKTCEKGGCFKCGGKKKYEQNDSDYLLENYFRNLKGKVNFVKMQKLQNHILKKIEPIESDLKKMYDEANQKLNGSKGKEIMINDGLVKPIFDPLVDRQVYYVTGMSGSGKSYFASELISSYSKLFPQNPIYLFSNKPDDPVLDKHEKLLRIKLDDALLEQPIGIEELKNSLVIYDDVEAIPSKKLEKELNRIRDLILQVGRSGKTSYIYISHQSNNYSTTRTILNEMTSITIFPQYTSKYSLKYLLERYFGLDKDQIKKINSIPSRWVTIFKTGPMSVLHERGAYLLN